MLRSRSWFIAGVVLLAPVMFAAYLWSSWDFRGRRMYEAFRDGHVTLGRVLIYLGADPNYQTGSSSPMHMAAARGDVDLMQFLVGHGAAVDVPVKWNVSPLHEARRCERLEAVRFLIAHGADPDRVPQTPP
jgi:ankyrin repeat protein